jgi:hypothetical protein
MALLEHPEVAPFAQACQEQIGRAARGMDVQVSPFAEEIMTLFVTSGVFEPVPEGGVPSRRAEGEQFYRILMDFVPPIIEDMLATSSVRSREGEARNLIMTADVYHWLADRGGQLLASLPCPFAK